MKLYTIKTISKDGTHLLVNGWNKHKKFWCRPEYMMTSYYFKTLSSAKSSLTKLLKVMPEYAFYDCDKCDTPATFETVCISNN